MIDLDPLQRQLVQRILAHRFPSRRVQAFGSRAGKMAKP